MHNVTEFEKYKSGSVILILNQVVIQVKKVKD